MRFVTINMFETVFNEITWDIHGSSPSPRSAAIATWWARCSTTAYSSLLEELQERGLLSNTMVVAMGEFGRTPKINPAGGRDHWPQCWTIVMAGGGIKGGQVVGASDEIGATRKTGRPRRPKWPPRFTTGWESRSNWNCRARRAGPFRWWIAAWSRSASCWDRAYRSADLCQAVRAFATIRRTQRTYMFRFLFVIATCGSLFAADLAISSACGSTWTDPNRGTRLIAEAAVEGHQEDWTRTAKWTSSDPGSRRSIRPGWCTPCRDGTATITATARAAAPPPR